MVDLLRAHRSPAASAPAARERDRDRALIILPLARPHPLHVLLHAPRLARRFERVDISDDRKLDGHVQQADDGAVRAAAVPRGGGFGGGLCAGWDNVVACAGGGGLGAVVGGVGWTGQDSCRRAAVA